MCFFKRERQLLVYVADDSTADDTIAFREIITRSNRNDVKLLIVYKNNQYIIQQLDLINQPIMLSLDELETYIQFECINNNIKTKNTMLCCNANLSNNSLGLITTETHQLIKMMQPNHLILLSNSTECYNNAINYMEHRNANPTSIGLSTRTKYGAVIPNTNFFQTILNEQRRPTSLSSSCCTWLYNALCGASHSISPHNTPDHLDGESDFGPENISCKFFSSDKSNIAPNIEETMIATKTDYRPNIYSI